MPLPHQQSLNLTPDECLERAGQFALGTFIDNGYMVILQSLGNDYFTFLANLDSMHDNFISAFPKMKVGSACRLRRAFLLGCLLAPGASQPAGARPGQMPSFRPVRNANGTCTVHYYSYRKELSAFTRTFLRTAAKTLFGLDIRVEHTIRRGVNLADHDQFTLYMPPR